MGNRTHPCCHFHGYITQLIIQHILTSVDGAMGSCKKNATTAPAKCRGRLCFVGEKERRRGNALPVVMRNSIMDKAGLAYALTDGTNAL